MDIDELLGDIANRGDKPAGDKWSELIKPSSSYLIVGDVGAGKSGLAYWLLERFSQEYNLTPYTVGVPADKAVLLPENFHILDDPTMCTEVEDAVIMIDEADIQLPMGDRKMKDYVINFLSLPRHRNQIFFLIFHYPRLVLGTYLPFFSGFFLKRPPYLMEFAAKNSKMILAMMRKAEERFVELPPDDVVKNTYVVSPRIRWEGMITNGLASFWGDDLSRIWAGTSVAKQSGGGLKLPGQTELSSLLQKPFLTADQDPYYYTMAELRDLCHKEGVPSSGDKHTLIKRLFGFW